MVMKHKWNYKKNNTTVYKNVEPRVGERFHFVKGNNATTTL